MATSSGATVTPAPTITVSNDKSLCTNKLSGNNKLGVAAIQRAFNDILKDPKSLDEAVHYMYQSLVDDITLGVFLEVHHLRKSGNLDALDGVTEDEKDPTLRMGESPNYDIFGNSTAKKPMLCICPNCNKPVGAPFFAKHLEKCMGMGRTSARIASRRLAPKEGTSASSSSSSYLQTNVGTDDEDDITWSSEKRRKKTGQNNRNGSKKNNGKSF